MRELGVPQGPKLGKVLAVVKDEYFGDPSMTAEKAMQIAKQAYAELK